MKQKLTVTEETNSREDFCPDRRGLLDLVRYMVGAARLCEDAFASTELKGVRKWEPRTLMHFHVLDRLATSQNGCLLQSELVSKPETAKSSALSSLLERMEQDGWIFREIPSRPKRIAQADQEPKVDRRKRTVKLTTAGRQVWEKIRPQFEASLCERLGNLSEQDINRIQQMVKDLRAKLHPKEE